MINEVLTINGVGFQNYGALRLSTRSHNSQYTTWLGPISPWEVTFFRVDGGGVNPDTLFLDDYGGTNLISGGALFKTGPGILQISGSASNTYTGGTQVYEGILQLAKPVGFNATGTGGIVIGDFGGGTDADVLQELNSEQIPQVTVTVQGSGLWDLGPTMSPRRLHVNMNRISTPPATSPPVWGSCLSPPDT